METAEANGDPPRQKTTTFNDHHNIIQRSTVNSNIAAVDKGQQQRHPTAISAIQRPLSFGTRRPSMAYNGQSTLPCNARYRRIKSRQVTRHTFARVRKIHAPFAKSLPFQEFLIAPGGKSLLTYSGNPSFSPDGDDSVPLRLSFAGAVYTLFSSDMRPRAELPYNDHQRCHETGHQWQTTATSAKQPPPRCHTAVITCIQRPSTTSNGHYNYSGAIHQHSGGPSVSAGCPLVVPAKPLDTDATNQ